MPSSSRVRALSSAQTQRLASVGGEDFWVCGTRGAVRDIRVGEIWLSRGTVELICSAAEVPFADAARFLADGFLGLVHAGRYGAQPPRTPSLENPNPDTWVVISADST